MDDGNTCHNFKGHSRLQGTLRMAPISFSMNGRLFPFLSINLHLHQSFFRFPIFYFALGWKVLRDKRRQVMPCGWGFSPLFFKSINRAFNVWGGGRPGLGTTKFSKYAPCVLGANFSNNLASTTRHNHSFFRFLRPHFPLEALFCCLERFARLLLPNKRWNIEHRAHDTQDC